MNETRQWKIVDSALMDNAIVEKNVIGLLLDVSALSGEGMSDHFLVKAEDKYEVGEEGRGRELNKIGKIWECH